ncbi:hypothetical protein R3P38DRAFT_3239126 [Favolaschia claudopus]|uniref:Uncharacterized protein n=1 Tax=Favolaschia claudopus TaxID=2862362 RepID=A0AAV9Z8T3_9AGAR
MAIHDTDMPLADRWEAIQRLEEKIEQGQRQRVEKKKSESDARYDVEGESLRTTSY